MERIFFCGECRKFFYANCEPTVYLCTCTHCNSVLTINCNVDKPTYNRYTEEEKVFFKQKIKDAYPDLEAIVAEQDNCRLRVGQMEERERARREELAATIRIPVTTGDANQDYEILGPVSYHIQNRGVYASGFNRKVQLYHGEISDIFASGLLSQSKVNYEWLRGHQSEEEGPVEIAYLISLLELKKRARSMGADSLIFMRQNVNAEPGQPNSFSLQMYATAVKFL